MSNDLEVRKREISALVDEVNAIERALQLPNVEGIYDDDLQQAMNILNRIERKMLANMPAKDAAE
jgi:hypothetical protein